MSEPLTMTVDGQVATLRELTVELPDGDTGYYQRGQECYRAAVATATQVPYEEVPNFRQLHEVLPWALSRGFMVDSPAAPFACRRWIASSPAMVSPAEYAAEVSPLARHVVVGAFDAIYFDPGAGWEYEGGLQGYRISIDELDPTTFLTIERTR